MDYKAVWDKYTQLKFAHAHDRDGANNYGCFNVDACRDSNFVYNSRRCHACHNCSGCIECTQCVDCTNCAFCVGLNGAEFHILNEQYGESEYYEKLRELGVDPQVSAY